MTQVRQPLLGACLVQGVEPAVGLGSPVSRFQAFVVTSCWVRILLDSTVVRTTEEPRPDEGSNERKRKVQNTFGCWEAGWRTAQTDCAEKCWPRRFSRKVLVRAHGGAGLLGNEHWVVQNNFGAKFGLWGSSWRSARTDCAEERRHRRFSQPVLARARGGAERLGNQPLINENKFGAKIGR